jgi:hypothetical protein
MDDERGKLFLGAVENGGYNGKLTPCEKGSWGPETGDPRARARAAQDTGGLAPVPLKTPEGSRPCRSRHRRARARAAQDTGGLAPVPLT